MMMMTFVSIVGWSIANAERKMTDKKDVALKLALEALEECRRDPRLKYEHPYYDKTITAIREALTEQPRLLSAAPCDQCGYNGPGYYQPDTHQCAAKHHKALAAQQQEPVGEVSGYYERGFTEQKTLYGKLHNQNLPVGAKLYTSPPANANAGKPWVPLTEFDIDQIPYSCSHADSRLIAFAIEAKLKEKNTQPSKPLPLTDEQHSLAHWQHEINKARDEAYLQGFAAGKKEAKCSAG